MMQYVLISLGTAGGERRLAATTLRHGSILPKKIRKNAYASIKTLFGAGNDSCKG